LIPRVDVRWANKKARCRVCGVEITVGKPELCEEYEKCRKFYHPTCWVDNKLNVLYCVPFRNNRHNLSPADREKRLSILRKYASLRQRQRKLKKPSKRYHVYFMKIEGQIDALRGEIEKVGGVPAKWSR